MHINDNDMAGLLTLVSGVGGIFCVLLISCFIWNTSLCCYQNYYKHSTTTKTGSNLLCVHVLGVVSVCMFSISCFFQAYRLTIMNTRANPNTFRKWLPIMIQGLSWRIGQSLVYVLFIFRFRFCFANTQYQASNIVYLMFYGLCVAFVCIEIGKDVLVTLWTLDVRITTIDLDTSDNMFAYKLALIDYMVSPVIDMVLSTSLLILFMKKLWRLNVDITIRTMIVNTRLKQDREREREQERERERERERAQTQTQSTDNNPNDHNNVTNNYFPLHYNDANAHHSIQQSHTLSINNNDHYDKYDHCEKNESRSRSRRQRDHMDKNTKRKNSIINIVTKNANAMISDNLMLFPGGGNGNHTLDALNGNPNINNNNHTLTLSEQLQSETPMTVPMQNANAVHNHRTSSPTMTTFSSSQLCMEQICVIEVISKMSVLTTIAVVCAQVFMLLCAVVFFTRDDNLLLSYIWTVSWVIDADLNCICVFLSMDFALIYYYTLCRICDNCAIKICARYAKNYIRFQRLKYKRTMITTL